MLSMNCEDAAARKKRLRREATQRWRSKPEVQAREKELAVLNAPLRAARRAVQQMRLQAGQAFAALQNARSGPEPTNMVEASQHVVLRAEAKMEAAALQVKIMQQLATPGFIRLESEQMGDIMDRVRQQLPTLPQFGTGWDKVFNPVATRFQTKLDMINTRSPYHDAAQTVLNQVVPYINEVLFGQQLSLHCVQGVFLASVKCSDAADAVPQHAHRDWPHDQLMSSKKVGFPVGVLISVHKGGRFHVWPGSLDAVEVRRDDMLTLELDAGDIVLFNGALVHAGAGYVGEEGEVHMRVHFYTSSTEHRRIWHVANKTELVQCNE
jgi:hypothetical protein